ncbi:phage tail protein [Enterobacter asburiae]|uniref:phage tail-collar fiber domain-containing protein n=1 Tax=Enterobacter asburiae TaxID=61645 RepID=UPI0021CB56FD|nr:phage tail protein [Enterobacter asburiae]
MSQTAITLVFEQWKAQQASTGEPVLLDEFVFALVPGLDPALPVDRSETLPPAAQIVHRAAVVRKGVVNENAVVHSAVLGADVGDFVFNWIGLINKASGTLAMIVHAPEQQKLKTKEGQQGNVLTRSFLMEFTGAQTETAINTPAETWQIDFTARMAGMDERQRLENIDIYGAGAFFGDGYLVGKTGNQYFVTQGAGYVAGLRAQLAANQNITVTTRPVKVWLDVAWSGTLTSEWKVQSKIVVTDNLTDYAENGVQHYVFALADIDASGNVTDLRPKGTLDNQAASDALKKHEQSRNHPDASTSAKGFTQLSNATDSDSEILAATPKAVKTVSDNVTKLEKSLGTAAKKDVQESRDDITPGRVLVNGGALALRTVAARAGTAIADASALPANSVSFCYADAAFSPGYEATILDVGGLGGNGYRVQYAASYADGGKRLKFRTLNADNGYWGNWTNVLTNYGGDVDHLSNASYYHINPAAWPGVGTFAAQYSNPVAPFTIPFGRVTPKGQSQYLPIIKGLSATEGYGFGAAVSFGILRSGNNDFGKAVIHIIGDNGKSAMLSFDTDGLFAVPAQLYSGGTIVSEGDITAKGGNIHAAGQLDCGGNIVAGQGLYESGGLVRVYSSNNPPPQQDLSPYATASWTIANFLQGGLRLASAGVATNGNNDNEFAYAPNGTVVTAVQQKTNYTAVQYRSLQYNIGGNWYTAWVA